MKVRKSTIAVLGKGIIPFLQLSRPVLLKMIIKSLKTLPKERLALIAYEVVKSKLPRLRKTKSVESFGLISDSTRRQIFQAKYLPKRKTKRKTKKIVGKIYYTKKGQPYKILASGKARFVKR